MSKSRLLKTFIAIGAVLSLISALALSALAAPDIKVIFNHNGSTQSKLVEAGQPFYPPTVSLDDGDIFYGWMDKNGNLYKSGQQHSFNADTTLYSVFGVTVNTAEGFFDAIANGKNYIKLTKSIEINDAINLGSGLFVLDTNGHTLTVENEGSAFIGGDLGLSIIGSGKVVHTDTATKHGPITTGLVSLSPSVNPLSLFVSIGENTSVKTNLCFISVETDISTLDGAFSSHVKGNLECEKLIYSNGILGASITFYESSSLSSNCEFLFENSIEQKKATVASATFLGGSFKLERLNGIATNAKLFKAAIRGGSFSTDISACFPAGNYKFKYNDVAGLYNFDSCTHLGIVVGGVPDSCEEAATIEYKCGYCDVEFTQDFPNGIGHSMSTSVERPLIYNEEITQAGIYKHYCQKCDEKTSYEYFYPDPIDTYVTVTIVDLNNVKKQLRVPARELFTFKYVKDTISGLTTSVIAQSFGIEYLEAEYGVVQARVLSVEVPLGVTEIYGEWPGNSDNGVGLFHSNEFLEEVVIPESVSIIRQCAFRNMKKLKTVKGLEFVTGTIERFAFSQKYTDVFFDHLVLNANAINDHAFENVRMNAITFGKNVSTIQHNAFKLSVGESVKEVFIEGNTSETPLTVSAAFSKLNKSYNSSGQQFGNREIVFAEHQCDVKVYEPSCYSKGYTHHICKYCDYERIDNELPQLIHDFKNVHVLPTCKTQGYTVDRCDNCGDEIASSKQIFEKTDPNAHVYESDKLGPLFIDPNTMGPLSSGYICENYYCLVRICTLCSAPCYSDTASSMLVSPLGPHNLVDDNMVITKEPNCGEFGKATIKCTVCSKDVEVDIPKSGENHKWNAGTITVVPTCTKTGVKVFECTICKSSSGIKEVVMQKDPRNHSWDQGVVEREPTEKVSGIKRITCTSCNESFTEGINKIVKREIPTWMIVCAIVGGVLLVAGTVLTLYFTLFKKKRASDGYKYKFNTLGK